MSETETRTHAGNIEQALGEIGSMGPRKQIGTTGIIGIVIVTQEENVMEEIEQIVRGIVMGGEGIKTGSISRDHAQVTGRIIQAQRIIRVIRKTEDEIN